ncbi:stage V sporulation protein R [Carboxydothermus islandicus]|uniref:Stage V sporulation protein R n=1 Tax=Carboxydothermus islandicus TaxID=661089 RepID=A0A1L8D2N6_9THEO|nr:SpoVR family protein [Carboxydothermus islandicus]GAV25448.1 stage V sporulation protein R [Carboxydothermus islandicus]
MDELICLEKAAEEIEKIALGFGLDFFPMRFEICPAEIIYTFGAYGMPTRFSHWTFGKAYQKMRTQYDYNLSRIYELVINTNPCYAFLLEGNSLVQNKLVIAHVYGHSDFFKNNWHFKNTNRKMLETMSVHARRIDEFSFRYGKEKVEKFLDAVLSIEEHIDPYEGTIKEQSSNKKIKEVNNPYADIWFETNNEKRENEKNERKPVKDLLGFIGRNSRYLEEWQREMIFMVREEMKYFWPQLKTKIMNEGWAAYWHIRIMRELDLTEDESIEFAKLNSQILYPSRFSINPYLLGLKIFENIEKRFGRDMIFEVREIDSDVSFIRNYLTEELAEELDLYNFQKVGGEWRVTEKSWEKIRDNLVLSLNNCGFPYIEILDGDYGKNGELYLRHRYEGIELDIHYLERTLPYVYELWGKPVHLETVVDRKHVLFTYNGEKHSRKIL